MKHFVDEQIQVELLQGTILEKKPRCPEKFFWADQCIVVKNIKSAWQDFSRKGTAAKNMKEEHALRAAKKGSWGVGRYYFEVEGDDNCIYTIYYDRAPENMKDRKGKWILFTYESP